MPRVPKWLANGMERVFSGMMNPVEVTQVSYLDSKLKQIQFKGNLSQTKFDPGQVIEFRVSDTDFRHYTPVHYDKEKGICEVLFYVHDFGPGSKWVERLQLGDQMKLMGPGGKMSYRPTSTHHFCFGDETSLGLCKMLQQTTLKVHKAFFCLLELDEAHQNWPALIDLPTEIVGKSIAEPAQEAIQYLQQLSEEQWQAWKDATFYLTGRAKSIQAFRKVLLRKGVNKKQLLSYPYWADGKKGL